MLSWATWSVLSSVDWFFCWKMKYLIAPLLVSCGSWCQTGSVGKVTEWDFPGSKEDRNPRINQAGADRSQEGNRRWWNSQRGVVGLLHPTIQHYLVRKYEEAVHFQKRWLSPLIGLNVLTFEFLLLKIRNKFWRGGVIWCDQPGGAPCTNSTSWWEHVRIVIARMPFWFMGFAVWHDQPV